MSPVQLPLFFVNSPELPQNSLLGLDLYRKLNWLT